MSLTFHSVLRELYTKPSIRASYQIAVHLATQFHRRRLYRNQPIRNKSCLWWPGLWTDWDEMNNLYRGPFIYASDQVAVHLAKRCHWRFFEIDKPETRIACGGHVFLTNRAEMSNLYKGPSIDASFGWTVSEKKLLRNRQIRNKNCLWWPCLLTDRDKINNLYREPYKDAFYQVLVHLAKYSFG